MRYLLLIRVDEDLARTVDVERDPEPWIAECGPRRLEGHQGLVRSLAMSTDGALLASVSKDGVLKLWDVAAGKGRASHEEGGLAVQAVAFAPDGRTLATGGIDRKVHFWDVAALLASRAP